jgi:hypothetical protein
MLAKGLAPILNVSHIQRRRMLLTSVQKNSSGRRASRWLVSLSLTHCKTLLRVSAPLFQ